MTPFIDVPAIAPKPYYRTDLGALFHTDCLDLLTTIRDECVDTVFADPPFNLKKQYGINGKDDLDEQTYVAWCHRWMRECVRILKPGGAFFLYNLPKWNILFGASLIQMNMTFRHWIAIDMKNCLPIPGRLYPSHYSILYFTKGQPKTFRRIRTPIETCRHCGGEIRDYGGHRHAMNPNGVNLKDVWTDIPPVRHWKFKSKKRQANALSTKILDRIVEISTETGPPLFAFRYEWRVRGGGIVLYHYDLQHPLVTRGCAPERKVPFDLADVPDSIVRYGYSLFEERANMPPAMAPMWKPKQILLIDRWHEATLPVSHSKATKPWVEK